VTLSSLPDGYTAVVFGASGGVGGALLHHLASDPRCGRIHAGSRSPIDALDDRTIPFRFDFNDHASLAAAANTIAAPHLVIVSTGLLHGANMAPEKTLRTLDPEQMTESFAINAIGPAMIARHVLPRLPRHQRSLFAVISARVGSISDNRLGGWHSYRAAKAALNMLVRCFSIEVARTHPLAVCVALHPGTVDTALSRPFQTGIAPDRLFDPQTAAGHLLQTLDRLKPEQTGHLFGWDGQEIPP